MIHLILPLMLTGLQPFVLTGISKAGGGFSGRDNHNPRTWQANLTGWRQRAFWAHQNGLEGFPMFAAAAIVAAFVTRNDTVTIALTWAHPVFRALYGYCYITDRATPRSLCFALGMLCVVGLYIRALTF